MKKNKLDAILIKIFFGSLFGTIVFEISNFCYATDGSTIEKMPSSTYCSTLIFSLIIGISITMAVYFKHKPVKVAKNANVYLNENSVVITGRSDNFVRQEIAKAPINNR